MITLNEEPFIKARTEIEAHLFVHAKDVEQYTDQDLVIDWETYKVLEQEGMIFFLVARDEAGDMAGYLVYVLINNPHHASGLWAEATTTFVMPEHRGEHVSSKMIEHAEKCLTYKGVNVITHAVVPGNRDYSEHLESKGFKCIEHKYAKEI